MRVRGYSPQAGEEVWALVRQHTVLFYTKALLSGLGLALPLAGMWYAFARWGDLATDSQQWSLATVTAVWLAYWVVRFYFLRYRQHNQAWLVTDRRLVHIYRRHWFKGLTNSLSLDEVSSVTVERPRLLGRLLGYGDVLCWRSDGRLALVMKSVAKPEELEAMVESLRLRIRAKN